MTRLATDRSLKEQDELLQGYHGGSCCLGARSCCKISSESLRRLAVEDHRDTAPIERVINKFVPMHFPYMSSQRMQYPQRDQTNLQRSLPQKRRLQTFLMNCSSMKGKDCRMKTHILKASPQRFIQILNCEGYK